jgi:hypothetical protein
VTAYYKIKSKFTHQKYKDWMTNFLTLKDCIVVYTTEDMEDEIRSLLPRGYPLSFIFKPLNESNVAQAVSPHGWSKQEKMDKEVAIGHSRELYWIWNEKSFFLEEVSEINPFGTKYFAWLDIGAVRHTRFNYKRLMEYIPKQKGIILLQINPFTPDELRLENGKCPTDFSKVDRIGGGMIAGDRSSIKKWTIHFTKVFDRYLAEGRFAGKDQSVMATTCVETDLCLMVTTPKQFQADKWFFLQDFFMGRYQVQPERLNITNSHHMIT